MFEKRDKKDAYGMLEFSRITGGDPNLFGSSVKHNQKIMLTLKEGHVMRELNNDWYGADKTLFEVEMSYTQFAELISAMNVGEGVPVTIRYKDGAGQIDGIEIENKRKQFLNEFEEKNSTSSERALGIINTLSEIFKEKRTLKAKEREEILRELHILYNEIEEHNNFILNQFDEAAEKITTEAKGEIEAFVERKMRDIALSAIAKKNELADLHTEVPILIDSEKEEN